MSARCLQSSYSFREITSAIPSALLVRKKLHLILPLIPLTSYSQHLQRSLHNASPTNEHITVGAA